MSKADKTKLLKANIEYYLVMSGYSKEQLATKLGISLASYYNKVKDINKFSYPEMVKLFSILKNWTKVKIPVRKAMNITKKSRHSSFQLILKQNFSRK